MLLALVAGLYVLSVPWYRSAGADTGTLLGMPGWAAVAVLCYLAAAVLNAAAWLVTDIPEASGDAGGSAREDAP